MAQKTFTPNFSVDFQQMVSYVAIAKTSDHSEMLRALVKQCLAILSTDTFKDAQNVCNAIEALFGIRVNTKDVDRALQELVKKGEIVHLTGNQLGLSSQSKQEAEMRIAEAHKLEEEVKTAWLNRVVLDFPQLSIEPLWEILKQYLSQAFRRHGIQAVTLLDPSVQEENGYLASLTGMLNATIRTKYVEIDHKYVLDAIFSFFSTVSSDRKRAEYITQLADGAFNFFSLTVAPEVAQKFREELTSLTLFLDTNFLFGLLDLHTNSQVDVSHTLVEAVNKFKLPFKFRYHDATTREMNNTLVYFGSQLRKNRFSQSLSRAAIKSGKVSGVELRYHRLNANQPLEVDDFLSPFKHWEIILKDQAIDIYKLVHSETRLVNRGTLEADYKEFLVRLAKEKPQDAIQHDMAVLETVRGLRSSAKSSLEAGALLVTCDTVLFRFDLEQSRQNGHPTCIVLPSLFWQILRPYVSDGIDYDNAFAETFALPEFSFSRGGAIKAASKMLSIMSSLANLSEETASKLLANNVLLAELQTNISDDEAFRMIESEIAKSNEDLIEEKAALEKQLSDERQQKKEKEHELAVAQQSLQERERILEQQRIALDQRESDIRNLKDGSNSMTEQIRAVTENILKEKNDKENAEAQILNLRSQKQMVEEQASRKNKIAGVIIALCAAMLVELLLHFVVQWSWLLNHSQSYGLQAALSFVVGSVIVGTWVKEWRLFLFGTAALGALYVAFQLLGGPSTTP